MTIKQLMDELVEIADNEGGLLVFDPDMVEYPHVLIPTTGFEPFKGIMYTPNLDKVLAVTNVAMMVEEGIDKEGQEFHWAYNGFVHCCPVIEFRPAKSLKHWPEDK